MSPLYLLPVSFWGISSISPVFCRFFTCVFFKKNHLCFLGFNFHLCFLFVFFFTCVDSKLIQLSPLPPHALTGSLSCHWHHNSIIKLRNNTRIIIMTILILKSQLIVIFLTCAIFFSLIPVSAQSCWWPG